MEQADSRSWAHPVILSAVSGGVRPQRLAGSWRFLCKISHVRVLHIGHAI